MDNYLQKIIEGVSNTRGHDFFQAITLQMNEVIGADYTFIARLKPESYSSETIALVAKGTPGTNFEYSLNHTPCANVADDSVCCYPCDVTQTFPLDQLLIDMNIAAYLGTPLHNSKGAVMGLIVALYEKPIVDSEFALTIFKIFSGRIEAEWERLEYEKQLKELNSSLEQQVEQRTSELQETVENLQHAQHQLVESEKMAAMGKLVAGVAHEVNTPLGIAVTSSSVLQKKFNYICKQLDTNELTMDDMAEFRETLEMGLPLIENNLFRASHLVESFKRTSADQHTMELEVINLAEYCEQIFATLHPVLYHERIQLHCTIPDTIFVQTYPGTLVQIFQNLVENSARHAFSQTDEENRHIYVDAEQNGDTVQFTYRDSGVGVDGNTRSQIFEPFFTTARAQGGTGLGMSILYNLVVQQLQGQVEVLNSDTGFCLEFSLPTNT